MTRTTQLKLVYFGSLVMIVGLALAIGLVFRSFLLPLALIVAATWLPQRIQASAYRDLFAAQRALAKGKPEESLVLTRRFLELIRRHPEGKRLLWLTGARYTGDVEALALNNLGASHLERGEWGEAEEAFQAAIRLDSQYAIPYFNLAVLAGARDDRDEAERRLAEAVARGFRAGKVEKVMDLGAAIRDRARVPAASA